MLPKSSAARASGGKTTRSKRSTKAEEGTVATLPAPAPSVFAPPSEAFTVEAYDDPGPSRVRVSFAKIPHVLDIPDLIELQKASYKWFNTDGL